MRTSDLFLDCFAVFVVQMRSFWIPTSGTFEQLEISLLITYFIFSIGKHPTKYFNKSEISICSKVPDVGIQKDRIWTTITAKQSRKRSEVPIPKNHPKTLQICTPEHSDQIWTVFEQFLGVGSSDLYLDCFAVIVVQIPTSGTFERLKISLLFTYFKFSNGEAPN